MTTEIRAVQIDGLSFQCRLDGPEGAPWMVFSNSLLTNLSVWNRQVEAFASQYRILRYDQRGHGGTDVPAQPATLDQLTEDAAILMTRIGARDAVFVGVSMGAATGFALAARRPDLVAALVASDGQAATAPNGAQAWQERIDMAREKGLPAFAEATLLRWFAAASHAAGNPAIAHARDMMLTTPEAGFVACARALQAYDARAGLSTLRQPVLLLAGASDGAMPQTMRNLADVIPDARFEEIAEAGHLPCLERPEAFNDAMTRFLGTGRIA
jgi:3-oxoadipate enol-lactonase